MIIPAKGRVLIKKIDRKEIKAESGIYMPGQTLQEESLFYGEIVGLAKEPSDEFKDFPYKVGDKVSIVPTRPISKDKKFKRKRNICNYKYWDLYNEK